MLPGPCRGRPVQRGTGAEGPGRADGNTAGEPSLPAHPQRHGHTDPGGGPAQVKGEGLIG